MFAFLHQPEINPVILQLWGPLAIRWYSLMYIAGFAAAYLFILWKIHKKAVLLTRQELSDILFAGFVGLLIGARLGYVLFYNLRQTLDNPASVIRVWEGGMSFHGGFIGIVCGFVVYAFLKKKNFFDLADVFAVPVPLGLAFGRWGNFVNGELWGRPTDAPWGMVFRTVPPNRWFSTQEGWVQKLVEKTGLPVPPGALTVNLPRHPSQLYQMVLEGLILFLALVLLSRMKNKPRGIVTWSFILGYGLARFTAEFFREPDAHIGYLAGNWFTMGMALSLPMIIAGAAGLIVALIRNERNTLWASSGN